jgi:hypothetical protein
MAFLFCGHKTANFTASPYWSDVTTATTFDANYTDSSILIPGNESNSSVGGGNCVAFGNGAETDIWFHMYSKNFGNSSSEDGKTLTFWGDTGEKIAGMRTGLGANNARKVTYADGINQVQVGSTFVTDDTAHLIDLHVQYNVAASGNITIEYYIDGTIQGIQETTAITTNSSTGIAYIQIAGLDGTGWHMSEVIIADQDTRGMRLGHMVPDGAGNHSAWDGAGTDISFNKDYVGISESTAAGRESWSLSAYSGPASPTTIHAVVNQVYATPGNSGPSQVDSFMRISATDYDSGAVTAQVAYPHAFNWTTNPNTAVAWVTGDFGALEAGVEAVT